MNTTNNRFECFIDRLHGIEVTNDPLINIKVLHYLRVFENYVNGVFLQYNRIKTDLVSEPESSSRVPIFQARLDIYYYTLTWDKLKKIFTKIKMITDQMIQILMSNNSIPNNFITEFGFLKCRLDHLFKEFSKNIRNEYEHPTLEFYTNGNIKMWGDIFVDGSGNIKAHAGKDEFALIKKEHLDRIQKLRVDLFDIFIKCFSKKLLTQELIKVRDCIENNIDSIIKELKKFKDDNNIEGFNELFNKIISYDLYLSKQNMQLSKDVKQKLYSLLEPSQ